MRTYALDFESVYSDECSIVPLGVWHYLRHPDCEIYMVSVVGDDGVRWVGHPKDFDWRSVSGEDVTWIAHNYAFDGACIERLRELGIIPDNVEPGAWYCTADLAAYLGFPRNLKGAIERGFGGLIEVSKDTRNAMKGKRWEDMTPEFQKEVSDYALHDADCCLKLWTTFSGQWPQHEREISRHTAWMGWNGLPVDVDGIDKGISHLKNLIFNAEKDIPWVVEDLPPLSPKALANECVKVGIEPPKSLAQDSEECARWEDQWGGIYPWVAAMRTYRRCNALLKKLETMRRRVMPNGRMAFGMKYAGAHTLRDSGDSGFNVQNLPRGEMFGVNMRELIKAPPGRTFVVVDLAQIEPRVLFYLADDQRMLDNVRAGFGIYEAFAVTAGMWNGKAGTLKKTDPTLYQTSKASTLGCGFGMSAGKFAITAPVLTGGAYKPTIEEAELVVNRYRRSYPRVPQLWSKLDRACRSSVNRDYVVELPSGRPMRYRQVQNYGELSAVIVRQGKDMRCKLWHGTLTENIVQATARDVFMNCLLLALDRGFDVVLRVHDELVIECDEADAPKVLDEMLKIMRTPPEWMPDIPLDAEGHITPVYTK